MQFIQLTEEQLYNFGERIARRVIDEIKEKPSEFISQAEMIKRCGCRKRYERAVRQGKIKIFQEGDGPKPRVFSIRKEFEFYLHSLIK